MNPESLQQQFFNLYGQREKPTEIFFAPGRVNLIGEHTDYNGGFVLPCALQYGTYLVVRKIDEPVFRFASANQEFKTEIPLEAIWQKINDAWINYPLGVINQFAGHEVLLTGTEFLYEGDIPSNAGLSSSASIEMVTAFALNQLFDARFELSDLINLSRKAENEFVGVNCGIMDQFAVGMGEKDHAIFLNCLTLEHKMVPLLLKNYRLVIVNSNKQRSLTESGYNERVAECQLAVAYLSKQFDISKLGEIGFMQFYKIQDQIPDELIRQRARHVISENQRVLNAVSALWKNDLLQFGALMNASHESLKENYEVTGFELDTLVAEAQKINGVLGARMTGAGFGGCTVNLVSEGIIDYFQDEVGKNYQTKTGLTADFYIAEISGGVKQLTRDNYG